MSWKDILSIAGGGETPDDIKAWLLPQKTDTVHSMMKMVVLNQDKRTREFLDSISPDRVKSMDEEVLTKLVFSMDAGLIRLVQKVVSPQRLAAILKALPENLLKRFPHSAWMALSEEVRKALPSELIDKINSQASLWTKLVRTHTFALIVFAAIVGVTSLVSFHFSKMVLGIRTPNMLSKPPTMFDELGQPIESEDTPDDQLAQAGVTDPQVAAELKKEFFNESINKNHIFVYWGFQTVLGFFLIRLLIYKYSNNVRWMPEWITFDTMTWIFLAYQAVFLIYILVFLYYHYVDTSIGTFVRGFGDDATYRDTRIPKDRFYFYMLMTSQFHVSMLVSLLALPFVQWGKDWLHGKTNIGKATNTSDGGDDDDDGDEDDEELQSRVTSKGKKAVGKDDMKEAADLAQGILGESGMKAAAKLAKGFMNDEEFKQATDFAQKELGMDVKKLMKGGKKKTTKRN